MGLRLFGSDSKDCRSYAPSFDTTPMPNKYNFTVQDEWLQGEYLIVRVHYPNATEYDGYKVAVYKGEKTMRGVVELDPHFIRGQLHNPIARFRGDDEGVALAFTLVEKLNENQNEV